MHVITLYESHSSLQRWQVEFRKPAMERYGNFIVEQLVLRKESACVLLLCKYLHMYSGMHTYYKLKNSIM